MTVPARSLSILVLRIRVVNYSGKCGHRDRRPYMQTMLAIALTLGSSLLCVKAAGPPQLPDWAYPTSPLGSPAAPPTDPEPLHVAGSSKSYTAAQTVDRFSPPDWHPEEHGPMPEVVAVGQKPSVFACAYCHLPNGAGRAENASLAGLSEAYIVQQIDAMKAKLRTGSAPAMTGLMNQVAAAVSGDDARAAARYFSSLKPAAGWIRVEEVEVVPITHVIPVNVLAKADGPGTESLGRRVIEIPVDTQRTVLRDSQAGYIAYVPVGSIKQGKALAESTPGEVPITCATCHGVGLKGLGDIPPLAGRSPSYLFRQLFDIQHGARTGPSVEPMKAVVKNLSEDDMLMLAAYLASLPTR
jgi:cytochrome c553